jgi:hypothetical protein
MAALGIRHYLAKPVEVAELGCVVREALHLEIGAVPSNVRA